MKKILSLIAALFMSAATFAQVDLETALQNAAEQFSENIESGSVVAILRISSLSADMSKYLLDTFTLDMVHLRKQTVVARNNLDMIAKELNFQLSGEVSEETMQQIGAKTGAQTIIFGEFKPFGTQYSLTLQAFDVTTAAILDMYSEKNISNSETIALLTGKKVVEADGRIKKNAYDYTSSDYTKIGFENILFGLGSYTHGHWGDGLLMTALETAGILWVMSSEDDFGINPYVVSLGVAFIGTSVIYGFVRPHWYHKPSANVGSAGGFPDGLNIGFVPTGKTLGASVSYKLNY